MAEGVLLSIAEGILESLSSAAVQEIRSVLCVKKDLEELKNTFSTIQAVLLDAEKKREVNNQVKLWLERLEDVANDFDNLLDDISTQALQRQVRSGNNMIEEVCTFFSSSNQLVCRFKMTLKIKDIKETLNKIASDRIQFHFQEIPEEATFMSRVRETYSFVNEENVIKRDCEKKAVIQLLLGGANESRLENFSVISIVGMGGLGKTTLARLVLNNKNVKDNFDLRIWTCVSDAFDVRSVVEKIIFSATNDKTNLGRSLDQLQNTLQKTISEKRFLVVLDDTWNGNVKQWQELKDLLMCGGKAGSKIMLTTRDNVVAKAAGSTEDMIYHLGILDSKKSWDLFKKKAFEGGQEPNDSEIVETGKAIVKKCRGNPLGITTIGSMLYLKDPKTEWPDFLKMEISKIPQEQDDILPTLKLSYDHLPSHLKHCFAYCSLFPKDYVFHVRTLIHLWMAQGFIKLSNESQCLEDVGYSYFRNLSSRSFFQEVETPWWRTGEICKMHDLMHDLALLVADKKCATLSSESVETQGGKKAFHLSIEVGPDSSSSQWERPLSLVQTKNIRSILVLSQFGMASRVSVDSVLDIFISKFKFLRTLSLSRLNVKIVPDSIGGLKHLRRLDLSRNEKIEELPNSISKLQNLQTLNLEGCSQLQVLPRDTSKLISLRSLEFGYPPGERGLGRLAYKREGLGSLSYMPRGLGSLTNLQTLSEFVVKKDSNDTKEQGAELSDLTSLNNLRGQLNICNLRHGIEFKPEYLAKKHRLETLILYWGERLPTGLKDLETLKGFQSPSNLKNLYFDSYGGAQFPDRLPASLPNGLNFVIRNSSNLRFLLPAHQFSSLKKLELFHLPALEYILENSDYSTTPIIMPLLKELILWELPNLKGWWKNDAEDEGPSTEENQKVLPSFACLSSLYIRGCQKLSCMPLYPTLDDSLTLWATSWKPFDQTMTMMKASSSSAPLSKLVNMRIDNIIEAYSRLEYLPDWFRSLSSLKTLEIRYLPKLKTLCSVFQDFTMLRELVLANCQELDLYDGDMWGPLQSLTTLTFVQMEPLVYLPEELHQLSSLQYVHIDECYNFAYDKIRFANSRPRFKIVY